jgi:hypothetical protein
MLSHNFWRADRRDGGGDNTPQPVGAQLQIHNNYNFIIIINMLMPVKIIINILLCIVSPITKSPCANIGQGVHDAQYGTIHSAMWAPRVPLPLSAMGHRRLV